MTAHDETLSDVFQYIDAHIRDGFTLQRLSDEAGYSPHHFSRLFVKATGLSVMSYVTLRKLQFARYDLAQGMKVLDVALDYGFETHAGFCKAFRRHFGYSPSICYLRPGIHLPPSTQTQWTYIQHLGGLTMTPHIYEFSPFSVVGYANRQAKPDVRHTADIPAFWDTLKEDCAPVLTKLHDAFSLSKHFEISMCYDTNPESGEFTYLLGRGIDNPADLAHIEPDMTRVDIPGGLYAVFSTTPADDYIVPIQETWNYILTQWLPQSEFEFDESRYDFEYYDHRDHGWYYGGKVQMDICIPIRQKEEEARKGKARQNG